MLAVACSVALSSCASTNESATMDLQTAKGIAMAMEDETALLVPPEDVADQTHMKSSFLLGCTDETYQWSGRTILTFSGEVDTQGIVDRIAAAWKVKEGVTVEEDDTTGDDAQVDMRVATGGFYNAAIWNSGTQLYITSFSPCFELEGGTKPGMKY